MSDYIKREDAIQAIVGHLVPKQYDGDLVNAGFETAHEIVDALPSADVVEVVRCKDCKYWTQFDNAHDFGRCNCSELKDTMDSFELYDEVWLEPKRNFYCGYGERKEQEHD